MAAVLPHSFIVRLSIVAAVALSRMPAIHRCSLGPPNPMSRAFQYSTPCSQNNKTYTEAWLVLSLDPIDRKHAST